MILPGEYKLEEAESSLADDARLGLAMPGGKAEM
jgi:hypothetical protein